MVDRFRDRLIFPIRDEKATVVGFIGRRNPTLDRDPSNPVPKYLNSPDSALFSKGRRLYGLSEARDLLENDRVREQYRAHLPPAPPVTDPSFAP